MRDKDFTRLYSEYAQPLYAFLSYRTGDRVLAEDLLADTFEHVLHARNGYDNRRASERTWLYTIALNCVRDHARRAAAEARAFVRLGADGNETAGPDPGLDGLELRAALREAMTTLAEEEREAVALRFGADLTLADIASVLGEPRSKVESRIYQGLKKLRKCLGPAFAVA